MNRLAGQFPALASRLAALSREDQRRVAVRLVAEAASAHALAGERLSQGDVDRLDEAAWALQESAEHGASSHGAYLAAFRRARAASAVVTLGQAALDEAIYEAIHAMPEGYDAERAVRDALTNG